MRFSLLLAISFIFTFCKSESQSLDLNLDFESYKKTSLIPENWVIWGDHFITKDSLAKQSNKYSILIQSLNNENSFGSIAHKLPITKEGKKITLEGYIKTENVQGSVGLLLRIDKNQESLEFENMSSKKITGSNNWQKYKITVPYHNDATAIYVGGVLSGKGKAWFDNLSVSVDGKDYQSLIFYSDVKEETKAFSQSDIEKEFEQKPYKDSEFEIPDILNTRQINNLATLAKEWGYLKYHHPLVASGKVDWDYELFKILPIVDATNFQSKLQKWKNSFSTTDVKEDIINHHYIDFNKQIGNPIFKNEATYPKMYWNDDGYKFLCLFRFWNMIKYFHPSKYLIKDWDKILVKYLPEFAKADDEISYKLNVLKLITEIKDSHSGILQMGNLIEEFFGRNIVPVEIKYIRNQFVVYDSLNKNSNLHKGDIITKLNEKPINDILDILKNYAIGSNETAKLRDVCQKILRTNKQSINITIQRNDKEITVESYCIPSYEVNFFQNKHTPSHKEIDEDIAYIYLGSLKKGEIKTIMQKYLDKKGIIIDLRCYPSDFVTFSLTNSLLQEAKEFAKFSIGSIKEPGKFSFTPSIKVGSNNQDYFKGKITVLVNELTQS